MSTEAEAQRRALVLDERLDGAVRDFVLPDPKKLFLSLRNYLQQRADEGRAQNVFHKIRLLRENGVATVNLGPSIDKGHTEQHFIFASGARLSFWLSLRGEKRNWRLLAYRFHLHLPRAPFEFLRFDLNEKGHPEPLREPRCHVHLGPNVRLPFLVLPPVDLLDRLFFVVEPAFR